MTNVLTMNAKAYIAYLKTCTDKKLSELQDKARYDWDKTALRMVTVEIERRAKDRERYLK